MPRASGRAARRPRRPWYPTQTAVASRPWKASVGLTPVTLPYVKAGDALAASVLGYRVLPLDECGSLQKGEKSKSQVCMHGRRGQPQTHPYVPPATETQGPESGTRSLGGAGWLPRVNSPVLTNLTSPNTGIRKDALLMTNATSRQKSKCCMKSSHASMTKRPEKPTSSNSIKNATFKLQTVRCKVIAKIPLSSNTISIKKPTTEKGIRRSLMLQVLTISQ